MWKVWTHKCLNPQQSDDFTCQGIGSPTISVIKGYVHDLTARKQCSRGLSSSMILLNRNELITLIVGLPMVKGRVLALNGLTERDVTVKRNIGPRSFLNRPSP